MRPRIDDRCPLQNPVFSLFAGGEIIGTDGSGHRRRGRHADVVDSHVEEQLIIRLGEAQLIGRAGDDKGRYINVVCLIWIWDGARIRANIKVMNDSGSGVEGRGGTSEQVNARVLIWRRRIVKSGGIYGHCSGGVVYKHLKMQGDDRSVRGNGK